MSPPASIVLLLLVSSSIAQQQNSWPILLPQVTIERENAGACPSAAAIERGRNSNTETIRSILHNTVISTCPCGGPGPWRRIAHLNMSDPNQQCPPGWRFVDTYARVCTRRQRSSCDSAIFPSNGASFSRVCGRIDGIQVGSTDAFSSTISGLAGLEGSYIDGVSVTHGAAGSRQHIWSFAAAVFETNDYPNYILQNVCPCTNTNFNWTYQLPSFIGSNYFCDTGNPGPGWRFNSPYPEDPLWDGEGCGPTNACCQFNAPPWLCTTLPQPTTDDIELRICAYTYEDIDIRLVDIYVM